MSKHVLVTGFEPFGGDQDNPSELVARAVAGRLIQRRRIATEVLPVETALLRGRLEAAVMRHQPDLILCLGEAKNRKTLALERVAVNLLNFDQPDNAGELRRKSAIAPTGPYARLCNLPLDDILDAWNRAGITGYVSNTAGSFLCNQVFYEALGFAERLQPAGVAAFVHLPRSSMSIAAMQQAVELLIASVVRWMEHRPLTLRTATSPVLAAPGLPGK